MHHRDYTVAIICALPVELAAARAMLTENHDDLEQKANDLNSYSFGRMGRHNVVIACLPYGQYGLVSAANVANQLFRTFTCIKIGLMVGIAGGIPSSKYDLRLGDVVVSKPNDQHGGVIQYDLAKTIPQRSPDGQVLEEPDFKITGHLNHPSEVILAALTKVKSVHDLEGPLLSTYLSEAYSRYPTFKEKYKYPGAEHDRLYRSSFEHVEEEREDDLGDSLYDDQNLLFCKNCDTAFLISRAFRTDSSPKVHYGLIASGNQLMRHGRTRDKIGQKLDAMCLEMEAAGLMSRSFLVIRGICDYADSHKNKIWQPYAASVAAAYARELLEMIPPFETTDSDSKHVSSMEHQSKKQGAREISSKLSKPHQIAHFFGEGAGSSNGMIVSAQDVTDCQMSLYFQELTFRYVGIQSAANNTCTWILDHPNFKRWLSEHRPLLWIKGKAGAGKSTLIKHILKHLASRPYAEHTESIILSYFFHGRGNMLQKTRLGFIRSILHQILDLHPSSSPYLVKTFITRREIMGRPGENWNWSLDELMEFFKVAVQAVLETRSIVILVDALDECGEDEAALLVENFHQFLCEAPRTSSKFKICFSCRYYPVVDTFPGLSIAVQNGNSKDIEVYARQRLELLRLRKTNMDKLQELITQKANGIFQWVSLIIQRIEKLNRSGKAFKFLEAEIKRTPPDLDELYSGLLQELEEEERPQALKLMQWICFAFRLLRVDELRFAMIIDEDSSYHSFQEFLDDDQTGDMTQRIITLSCGLVEVQEHANQQYVQFIHQSAEDFFQRKGFAILDCAGIEISSFAGVSHRRIAGSCIRYFSLLDENTRSALHPHQLTGDKVFSGYDPEDDADSKTETPAYAFLQYAMKEWARHSRCTDELQCPNKMLLDHFRWPSSEIVDRWSSLNASFRFLYPPWRSPSFLHLVAKYNLISPLRAAIESLQLLKKTTDPKDWHGRTPLSYAAEEGHVVVTELLLRAGDVDIDSKDSKNRTPLWWATLNGHNEVIKVLLSHGGVDVNIKCSSIGPPLRTAVFRRSTSTIELLLCNGADVNAENRNGQTPLFLAAKGGPPEIVELLIQHGANIHHEDINRRTPLFSAVESTIPDNSMTSIQLLLDAGANASHQDAQSRTPLVVAVMSLHTEEATAGLLIDHGSDIRAQDELGRTALSWAASLGFLNMTKFLMDRGLDINHQDADKQTPLFLAALNGRLPVVEFLVRSRSVNIGRPDKLGRSPLQVAREQPSPRLVKALVKALETAATDAASPPKV